MATKGAITPFSLEIGLGKRHQTAPFSHRKLDNNHRVTG
jgi:hypothetical protein